MRRFKILGLLMASALLLSAPLLSACSVGMAVSGEEDPNLAVCKAGSTRAEIERELGYPRAINTLEDGSLECVYEYEIGNEPSAGRAVLHAGMDILTLGLWEVVGTPVEAVQGTKYEMTVVYGSDGVAQSVKTTKVSAPPPKKKDNKGP